MHLMDMYTREKVNQLHLDKMRRDRPYRSLLRGVNSTRNIAASKWMRLLLIFATVILLPGAFHTPASTLFNLCVPGPMEVLPASLEHPVAASTRLTATSRVEKILLLIYTYQIFREGRGPTSSPLACLVISASAWSSSRWFRMAPSTS